METMTFATAESTRALDGETYIEHADRTYCPTFPGVHVCGADREENRFYTVADFPMQSDDEAREAWQAARVECEVPQDEADFTVDLNEGEGHVDDFWSNRQMLPRLAAILTPTPEASS